MKFNRNSIWLIPLFFIISFPLWSVPVADFLKPRGDFSSPEVTNSHGHNFSMETVKIIQSQNGQRTALIRAKSARTTEDPNVFEMEAVDADLLDAEGNITHVVAKKGKYDTTQKLLTLIEDVVVNKRIDKQFLYSDLLFYHSSQRTINSPGKTKLEGPNVVINGGSLDYDIATQTYLIANRVHCIINGFVSPP